MNRAVDSKRAISERQSLRQTLVGMLRMLGAYVESVARDLSDVLASGFEPAYLIRQPSTLKCPAMKNLAHGPTSGTIEALFTSVDHARVYDLCHTEFKPAIAEDAWILQKVFVARFPTTITGLTPGVVYAFRVRAHGVSGTTDWSQIMTIMCV